MGTRFDALSAEEKEAVNDYVRGEYDKLIFQHPTDYVTRNAQADPEAWQKALRDMIVSDRERVEEITRAARRKLNKSGFGFTLIELSIVLVIIGLIVGGIIVGQSLINAAGVRAEITQVEKFQTAVATFYGKYGYLPGDIPDPPASSFGFAPRGAAASGGQGDGVIGENTSRQGYETSSFWNDLSYANGMHLNLIEGNFTASPTIGLSNVSGTGLDSVMPVAKLGNSLHIYIYSFNSANYFALANVTSIDCCNGMFANPGTTVKNAAAIDAKIDDGLPQSGNVTARLTCDSNGPESPAWPSGGPPTGTNCGNFAYNFSTAPYTTATPGSSLSCFDNGNVSGAPQQYSVEISNGSNVNCALSFKMQAGD